MTTYNTGNPIGSTDPRDLYDNSQVFDELINNLTDFTTLDRFGNSRVTLAGQIGYIGTGVDGAIESYTSGLTLTTFSTIIEYNGSFYRPSASATLPYTTTATLPPSDSNLTNVGDAVLRQDLANNANGLGASIVSMESGGGSVQDAILIRAASPEDFGAIGDGVADDTVAWIDALAASKNIIGKPGSVYKVTESLVMEDDQEINLNGSTLQFEVVGEKRCVVVNDNGRLRNGTITNNVGTGGFTGDFQTPVCVGVFDDANSRQNVLIENLYIDTVTPNGNGIAVFGDTSNFVIRNIVFPSNVQIGRCILVHWSYQGTLATPTDTYHPNNGAIQNVRSLGMLNTGITDGATIFLSASYNIDVDNVKCDSLPTGDIVRVYAGDFGFQYAQNIEEEDLGSQGIRLSGIYGVAERALQVAMFNPDGAVSQIWGVSVDCSLIGAEGDDPTDPANVAVSLSSCSNVTVRNSRITGFYEGIRIGQNTENIHIHDNIIVFSARDGLRCTDSTARSLRITDNWFTQNNDDNVTAFDIYLESCRDVLVHKNLFNSPQAVNNVRLGSAGVAPIRVKIIDNHVDDVSAGGPCFLLGASGDDKPCILFSGNTSIPTPTNGIVSGQLHIIYDLAAPRFNGNNRRIGIGAAAPTAGSWLQGDRIDNANPSVDGNNMIISGWICTVSGSPGTWQPMNVSTVSPAT